MENYKRPFEHLTLSALKNALKRLESYRTDRAKPLIADVLEELAERGCMTNRRWGKHF